MSKAKRCGNQVGVPQQARQARCGDKKQGSIVAKGYAQVAVWILRRLLLLWLG
jgi:hypothetical protein